MHCQFNVKEIVNAKGKNTVIQTFSPLVAHAAH